ncbi:MAG: hypothetical protein KGL39_32120 [Patescibacteria group bacterium]|nr:hypothetical protein [Patescibacteria group bacterium]
MTYPVFTSDEVPSDPAAWPEHKHQQEGQPVLKAQPVQGIFGVEKADGSVQKCTEGYGFLVRDEHSGELSIVSLSEFKANYKGAEHIEV